MTHRLIECPTCRQMLPPGDFGAVGRGQRQRRRRECEACRHSRLAREHEREAAKLYAIRRWRREREQANVEAARAAAGRD